MNVESSSILLRQHDFYQQHGIEMWMGKEVRARTNQLQMHVTCCHVGLSCFYLCCRWSV